MRRTIRYKISKIGNRQEISAHRVIRGQATTPLLREVLLYPINTKESKDELEQVIIKLRPEDERNNS